MVSEEDRNIAIIVMHRKGFTSLAGFAKIAGVSYPTALKMAKKGQVQTIKVGGINRVYSEEVTRFFKEGNLNVPQGL